MFENKRIIVLKYGKIQIDECVKKVSFLLNDTTRPHLIFLNLSKDEFPNKFHDLPGNLINIIMRNPIVKINWDGDFDVEHDATFKYDIHYAKPSCEEVTVGLCTQPHRKIPMMDVVKSLLPQCDRMCICFNNYNEIPRDIPKSSKLVCVLAGQDKEYPDVGAQNKMLFLGDFDGYYASVDDDLVYPSNYIEEMKKRVDSYNRERICSLHGMVWNLNNHCIIDKRDRLGFWQYFNKNETDHLCHCVGMGVAMYYPRKIGLDKFFYLNYPKNIGDDQITAVWGMVTNTKLMQVNNVGINVTPTKYAFNGMYTDKEGRVIREQFIKSYRNWKDIDIQKNEYC